MFSDQVARAGAKCKGHQNREPVEGLALGCCTSWIERVLSEAYHAANVAPRAMTKNVVTLTSETPKLSTRLSVISVPTMLTSTTASQYDHGT